jgi:hypothetical protein
VDIDNDKKLKMKCQFSSLGPQKGTSKEARFILKKQNKTRAPYEL